MQLSSYLTTVTPVSRWITIALLIILPILGFIVGMQYQQAVQVSMLPSGIVPPQETPSPTTAFSTYTNKSHGYTFAYSAPYTVKEFASGDGSEVFGGQILDASGPVVDMSIEDMAPFLKYPCTPGDDSKCYKMMDFPQFAIERAITGCDADGPGMSITCSDMTNLEHITTSSGIEGLRFSLTEVHTAPSGTTTNPKGPIYALNISNTSTPKILYFTPDTSGSQAKVLSEAQQMALEQLVQSLKLQ